MFRVATAALMDETLAGNVGGGAVVGPVMPPAIAVRAEAIVVKVDATVSRVEARSPEVRGI